MISEKQYTKLSKFMSLVLRHAPETINLSLDANGWANVEELIEKMTQNGKKIDRITLEKLVTTNNKKRFAFNEDKTKIRASQGHSIEVNLGYIAKEPPEYLYHGTSQKTIEIIFQTGIQKMSRHHVHLSTDKVTAEKVGMRHGKPIILTVASQKMANAGYQFYQSENGVWLVDEVPIKFIKARH